MKLCENTLAVRSERNRASGEAGDQAGRKAGSLRLRSARLKPNGKDATASEEVYESSVVCSEKVPSHALCRFSHLFKRHFDSQGFEALHQALPLALHL